MDKIEKSLRRVTKSEREKVAHVIELLYAEKTQGLNVKKLTGYQDVYRVRTGRIRIIYRKTDDILLLDVSFRDDNTYRKF